MYLDDMLKQTEMGWIEPGLSAPVLPILAILNTGSHAFSCSLKQAFCLVVACEMFVDSR